MWTTGRPLRGFTMNCEATGQKESEREGEIAPTCACVCVHGSGIFSLITAIRPQFGPEPRTRASVPKTFLFYETGGDREVGVVGVVR